MVKTTIQPVFDKDGNVTNAGAVGNISVETLDAKGKPITKKFFEGKNEEEANRYFSSQELIKNIQTAYDAGVFKPTTTAAEFGGPSKPGKSVEASRGTSIDRSRVGLGSTKRER